MIFNLINNNLIVIKYIISFKMVKKILKIFTNKLNNLMILMINLKRKIIKIKNNKFNYIKKSI